MHHCTPVPQFQWCRHCARTVQYWLAPDEIEGKIPEKLCGTFLRNGPGKFEGGLANYFDGDGFIMRFAIKSGRCHVAGRFVNAKRDEVCCVRVPVSTSATRLLCKPMQMRAARAC